MVKGNNSLMRCTVFGLSRQRNEYWYLWYSKSLTWSFITARIRRMEKVMFSVCSHLGGGAPWPGPEGGLTWPGPGGTPQPGPDRRIPRPSPDGGYPGKGMGYPPGIGQQMEYLIGGGQYASSRGGVPPWDRTADGVLDIRWAECLLFSHRRTFLS